MNLVMISAMYENGGNVLQRHLDGHPELFVYPFESQLGTRYVNDELSSMFPYKYRWTEFTYSTNDIEEFYNLIYDEELKTRVRRPDGSKFKNADLQLKEKDRITYFKESMVDKQATINNIITSFFYSTFSAWKNYKYSGREKYYVGYSPIIAVDAEKMISDFPDIKILHMVRNPESCYAETTKRPFPMSLENYIWAWCTVQHRAVVYAEKYPNNIKIIKYNDLLCDKEFTMIQICKFLNIEFDKILLETSWNANILDNIYPWGTINNFSVEEDEERKNSLTTKQKNTIESMTKFIKNVL